jgi:F0F1-type ATP synthase assembly protein I
MVKQAKKVAKKRKGPSSKTEDPALAYLPEFNAQSQLMGSMLNVGWRLALTVLIPVFIGIWADNKFGTKPSFTITALFIAVAVSSVVIYQMYKDINIQTSKMKFKKTNKSKIIKGYDDDITD